MRRESLPASAAAALLLFLSALVAAQEVSSDDTARTAKRLFTPCRACHSLEKDATQNNAPTLYALLGRKAGSQAGFDYSTAMKESPIVWSEQTLDGFLKDPQAAIPGNKMAYAGMPDETQRKILIGYLKESTRAP